MKNLFRRYGLLLLFVFAHYGLASSQDTIQYLLRLDATLFDYSENASNGYQYPSMQQSLEWSSNLYDLGFWGVHKTTNLLFQNRKNTRGGKLAQEGLAYALGLVFSKYGSELPLPLGVWAHESYHRSVLGTAGKKAINGNSLLHRWNGTVYGLTDDDLAALKSDNLSVLLHSYVAGVQSEIHLTQTNVISDFYENRSFYKNPLYLYNAWYVYDYFKFATSASSDSVKVLAPPHEDPDPYFRDYAGADLTAWVYDMVTPSESYLDRDSFPNGDGVNRRIGYSDLTTAGQEFLKLQKSLSLLNFVNPAIFFVNRINVSANVRMQLFMQYAPTLFGNEIALFIPFTVGSGNQLFAVHRYQNMANVFWGLQYGLHGIRPFMNKAISLDGTLSVWNQPEHLSYFDQAGKWGGNLTVTGHYDLGGGFSTQFTIGYKTDGWIIGNPFLTAKTNLRIGLSYTLAG